MNVDAEKLKDLARKSSAGDGGFLLMAKEESKRRMKEDPSPRNIEAFNRASRALDEHLARQGGEEDAQAAPASFKNAPEVLKHLTGAGWKVSRAKIFADAKAGILRGQPDGSYTSKDVELYIRAAALKLSGGKSATDDELARLRIKQLKAEIRERENKAEMAEMSKLERAGELIGREDADVQMALAVTVLRSQMKAFFASVAPEAVHVVAGDPSKVDEMQDLFSARMNEFFNGFAKKREYKVVDGGEGDGPGALD